MSGGCTEHAGSGFKSALYIGGQDLWSVTCEQYNHKALIPSIFYTRRFRKCLMTAMEAPFEFCMAVCLFLPHSSPEFLHPTLEV